MSGSSKSVGPKPHRRSAACLDRPGHYGIRPIGTRRHVHPSNDLGPARDRNGELVPGSMTRSGQSPHPIGRSFVLVAMRFSIPGPSPAMRVTMDLHRPGDLTCTTNLATGPTGE